MAVDEQGPAVEQSAVDVRDLPSIVTDPDATEGPIQLRVPDPDDDVVARYYALFRQKWIESCRDADLMSRQLHTVLCVRDGLARILEDLKQSSTLQIECDVRSRRQ